MTTPDAPRSRRWWRRLTWAAVTMAALVATAVIAFNASPRPGSVAIRWAFDKAGRSTNDALAEHVPPGVDGITGVSYGDGGKDTTLDAWFPSAATGPLPTVVWVHGGGWVSGDKSQVANYLKIIAARGFTVIGVNYSLAPGTQYPTPVRQVDQALAHITANAAELHVDPATVVLAGDSAGAQIAAQLAAATADPAYAAQVGITPSLPATALAATVLNCGPYVPSMVRDAEGAEGWFVRTVAWAYLGTKDFDAPIMGQADLVEHATASFPPTWISSGNDDPLTPQGKAFAARLAELGVDVTTLFFPDDHEPRLGHEYQFDLSLDESRRALDETVAFLKAHTSSPG